MTDTPGAMPWGYFWVSVKTTSKENDIGKSLVYCVDLLSGRHGRRPGYGICGYELKTAVGTSVFIMTFTALTGSVSHFTIGGQPDWLILGLCVVFTFLWARVAARFANKASAKTLNRATGVILVVLGIVILTVDYLK